MKHYKVNFSDDSFTIGIFSNKKEALAAGRLYCRQWQLEEKCTGAEEITPEEYESMKR